MIQNDMFDTAAKEGLAQGVAIGRAEGEAIGLEKGLEKGRSEGVMATARSLKALRVPTDTIIQATGLSAEEIERL